MRSLLRPSRSTLAALATLLALLCSTIGATARVSAAAPPTPTHVVVLKPVAFLVDFHVKATGLSSAAAMARAASLAHFKLKVPASLPKGMSLQQINVQPTAGDYSPIVTFWYASSPSRNGFRLHEQVAGKLFDKSGTATRVGKTTVYVTTSMAYVYVTWTDGKLVYSLDNVVTRSTDIDLKGLLTVAKALT
jgi:hypothetical protein